MHRSVAALAVLPSLLSMAAVAAAQGCWDRKCPASGVFSLGSLYNGQMDTYYLNAEYRLDYARPMHTCTYFWKPNMGAVGCGFYIDDGTPDPWYTACTIKSLPCVSCSSGYSFVPSSGECLACPTGHVSSNGNTGEPCVPCVAPLIPNRERSACVCPDRSGLTSSGACSPCPAGSISLNSPSCTACPAGAYASAEGTACVPCPGGTSSSAIGADSPSTCLSCLAGTYSGPGSAGCTACRAGTFGRPDRLSCDSCPAGTSSSSVGAVDSSVCAACTGTGYSFSPGSGSCLQCAAAQRQVPKPDRTGCNCLPGYARRLSAPNLPYITCSVACTPGTYADGSMAACAPCPAGTVSAAIAGSCADCEAGSYKAGNTCLPCGQGLVSQDKATSCEACSIGYQPNADQSACVLTPTRKAAVKQRALREKGLDTWR